jgi:hypothetical protein
MVTLTREFMPTSFKATFESGFVIVSTHDSLQYSEERLQAIQLSILLPMSQCKVPVVCSKSCIERTMQRLDNARQQVGVTKQQGAARCIELTEAVEVHLGVVANSKMANVAVIRSKFGFICIGNARILSDCSKDCFGLTEVLLAKSSFPAEDAFLVLQAHLPHLISF